MAEQDQSIFKIDKNDRTLGVKKSTILTMDQINESDDENESVDTPVHSPNATFPTATDAFKLPEIEVKKPMTAEPEQAPQNKRYMQAESFLQRIQGNKDTYEMFVDEAKKMGIMQIGRIRGNEYYYDYMKAGKHQNRLNSAGAGTTTITSWLRSSLEDPIKPGTQQRQRRRRGRHASMELRKNGILRAENESQGTRGARNSMSAAANPQPGLSSLTNNGKTPGASSSKSTSSKSSLFSQKKENSFGKK